MNPAVLQSPFVQTALPIMFTILVAVWVNSKSYDSQNRRIYDLNRRFDDTNRRIDEFRADAIQRLDRIEAKFDDRARRIIRVEERTPPMVRA